MLIEHSKESLIKGKLSKTLSRHTKHLPNLNDTHLHAIYTWP